MPFGLIFGALFFGALCPWVGARLLAHPTDGAKIAGTGIVLLGLSLAIALLRRQSWARWAGVLGALVAGSTALRLLGLDDGIVVYLLVAGGATVAALLAVPATGDPARGAAAGPRRGGMVFAVGALGGAGLLLSTWGTAAVPSPAVQTAARLPASAAPTARIPWTEFGAGLAQAQAEGKPLLVTFFTDWCGYCKKMDRNTWRAATVVARLQDVVPVRVNAEESGSPSGMSGEDLADRYGVRGLPAQFLLDGQGRVLARADGYLSPTQFVGWLDDALRKAPRPSQTRLPGV